MEEPYIKQPAEGENLYTQLQKQTLKDVQRFSGKVWTDFNIHNPGVTLMDIANYALTEMDYKLNCDLWSYLTPEKEKFEAKRIGLFPAEEVYTTSPITVEDYCQMFYSHIPELANVRIDCNPATGGYTAKLSLAPFEADSDSIVKQVRELYHSHRNLCEHLEHVIVTQPDELIFHAEFEIEPGASGTRILAKLYCTILQHLSGSTPQAEQTEYELYKKLRQVKGIHSFSTCYLMKDGEPLTEFSQGYSLLIPQKEEDLKVRIRCGNCRIQVDMEKFTQRLKELYYIEEPDRTDTSDIPDSTESDIEGIDDTLFTHFPIARDFPACYHLSPENEASTVSFEAYLSLYDRIIRQGLQEVKDLRYLFSIEEKDTVDPPSPHAYMLKSRYLDFLDQLYSVESQPAWMQEFEYSGETEENTLRHRTEFLRHVPRLIKNRAQAVNITREDSKHNVATIKEWFYKILGIDEEELNHSDEKLHVVEPILCDPSRPFTLLFILPAWTPRFQVPRFREVCKELLRSLLPAHLRGTIYWIDHPSMLKFEEFYQLWRKSLTRQYEEVSPIWLRMMDEALSKPEEIHII